MNTLQKILPPFIYEPLIKLKYKSVIAKSILNPNKQDLDMYWDEKYANALDKWGQDNVWNEIQLLATGCEGKILDIACGTGIAIQLLSNFEKLNVYGFDISDLLIAKAISKGISKDQLKIIDATKTDYEDNEFGYSYSIGSLEHFTEEGIDGFLRECSRYTSKVSFHMIPTSRAQKNEGWLKTHQSFFNNSVEWWLHYYTKYFRKVIVVDSKWNDPISVGKWFICFK